MILKLYFLSFCFNLHLREFSRICRGDSEKQSEEILKLVESITSEKVLKKRVFNANASNCLFTIPPRKL